MRDFGHLSPRSIASVVASFAWLAVSCKSPTQIELEVTTDLSCERVRGLAISAGSSAEGAETATPSIRSRTCTASNGSLGTLFLQPEGSGGGAVFVRVVAGVDVDVDACEAPAYRGCIVARRELKYARGETLRVQVALAETCVSEACSTRSTCASKGTCVDSTESECLARGDCNARVDGGLGDGSSCGTPCAPCTENYCGAELQTDTHNCGRCGHDCLGAACTDGVCESRVIVGAAGRPGALALQGEYIYFTDKNVGVSRGRKDAVNGTPQRIHSATGGLASFEGVVADASQVFFATNSGVFACPLAGCGDAGATPITTGTAFRDVALAPVGLVGLTAGDVRVGPKTGPLEPLASTPDAFRCAADATYAYVSRSGRASRAPLDRSAPLENIGEFAPLPGWIALTDDSVYWTAASMTEPGRVQRWQKSSKATTQYPNTSRLPAGITADACNVYWSVEGDTGASNGQVLYCPIEGCSSPRVLFEGLDAPTTLVSDADAVYVAEIRGGKIRRIVKP